MTGHRHSMNSEGKGPVHTPSPQKPRLPVAPSPCPALRCAPQDVVCGVTFLHGSNVIHNDLKAHNILVDRNFTAKVADFGLATLAKGKDGAAAALPVGTPFWMAPELLRHEVAAVP